MNASEVVEEILNEGSIGRVFIDSETKTDWLFDARFYAEIEGITNAKSKRFPIFKIYNFESFVQSIENYLKVARNFYEADQEYFDLSDDSFDKKLIFDLFVNANQIDMFDFERYVLIRTEMLETDIDETTTSVGGIQDLEVRMDIVKNHSNLEAPYRFDSTIIDTKTEEEYHLPSVYFAHFNKETHIMAIRNIYKKQNKKISKGMIRLFKLLCMGEPKHGVIRSVPTNIYLAITLFLAHESNMGRVEFYIPCSPPLRHYVKYHTNKIVGFRHLDDIYNKITFEQKNDFNKLSKTHRFMRLLLRFNYHFPNARLYFDEVTKQIKISLDMNLENEKDLNIIQEVYTVVREKERVERALR